MFPKFSKRITFFTCLLLLSLLFAKNTFADTEETLTLEPIADACVSSAIGKTDSNFGGEPLLEISRSSSSSIGVKYGYIKFDLSSIPSDATIQSVHLELYIYMVTETHEIGVHYCPDNTWTEYEITWNNRPDFNTTGYVLTVAKENDEEWYTWGKGPKLFLETAMEASSDTLTIVITCHSFHETAWIWIWSRDQEDSSMKEYIPKLIINYSVPSPPAAGIPGFPLEGIIVGIAAAAVTVYLLRKRTAQPISATPRI